MQTSERVQETVSLGVRAGRNHREVLEKEVEFETSLKAWEGFPQAEKTRCPFYIRKDKWHSE